MLGLRWLDDICAVNPVSRRETRLDCGDLVVPPPAPPLGSVLRVILFADD